jgi:signal peptidase II
LAYNLGAAFSVLAEADGWQRYALSSIAIAASVFIIYLLRKHHHEVRFSLSLSFILGGAVGNLIDRIAYGHVIDFIDFYIKEWHWPAFNIADSAICIGAVLMVIDAFLTSDRKQRHA